MSEALFQEEVLTWCEKVIAVYKAKCKEKFSDRLAVESRNLLTAWQPWSYDNSSKNWHWLPFKRQIDVVFGLTVEIDGAPGMLPLVVIELKSGSVLNSDEIDKKSAIYGPLREIYPWIHTVFLHKDMSTRNLGEEFTLRNGRQFDSIFTEWNDCTKCLLQRQIEWQMEYLLEYWKL